MSLYYFARCFYKKAKRILPVSFINQIKSLYNSWYWKERHVKKPIGNKASITPYIIRRYAENMGIGSYIISNLSHIDYALQRGFVPVVDMYSYNSTLYSEQRCNTWSLFYLQPIYEQINRIEDAYKYQSYVLSNGGIAENAPNDSMEFLCNKEKLRYWSAIYKKYCVLNKETRMYFQKEFDELFTKSMKTVGVLCRGTDYALLRPAGHPVQPSVEQVIKKVVEVMQEYSCDYIYLATEDINIENKFKSHFGKSLITNKRVYKQYQGGYLAKTSNRRENDSYYTNLEYLSSLNILSKCNCIVAGRTSGTVLTMLMNYEYEYCYFWDLGVYENL